MAVATSSGTGGVFPLANLSICRSNIHSNSKFSVFASVIPTNKQPRRKAPDIPEKDAILEKKSGISIIGEPHLQAVPKDGRLRLIDYFEQCAELVSKADGGPPRWFLPLECGSRLTHSPLMLVLPGIDGVGLGLILHHERLGKIFDIWCLHIPIPDRTSFTGLVKRVESTVRSEHSRTPCRPIYLVGESFGGCLALSVAARNPEIDILLIVANPGVPLKMVTPAIGKRLPFEQMIRELSQETIAMSSYLSVLSNVLTVEILHWKLNMLKSAAGFANSRLHAVKSQTLVLASGRDQLLPSIEEAERLSQLLPNCEIRVFDNNGHALFLEDGFKFVSILTGTSFYRRGGRPDYVFDYLPPTPSEFEKIYEPQRWIDAVTSPVLLSTLESGKIVRGLAGIPSQGPVLYVGYHMMLGLELVPLVAHFWMERNIVLRGIAHPMMFSKLKDGKLPAVSAYDTFRKMGAVPVSASNFYKLFSSNSHVLLYPGGMREALHRKGEEYKLFWPEQSEFVRMAANFGAKIIPFGSVGDDDIGQLILDYHDLRNIPYLKEAINELTDETVKLRSGAEGEVANQDVHLPIILPKVPGRFYYLFGRPIPTQGRKQELKNKERADELYRQVKSEVEKCLAYLREKRGDDPYRNIIARLGYKAMHGFDSEVPTFDQL